VGCEPQLGVRLLPAAVMLAIPTTDNCQSALHGTVHCFDLMRRGSLDATPLLVVENRAHVDQAGPRHLSGELHGAPRHDLHHVAAVVIFPFLAKGA